MHRKINRQHVMDCQLKDCAPLEWSATRGGDEPRHVALKHKAQVRQNNHLQNTTTCSFTHCPETCSHNAMHIMN